MPRTGLSTAEVVAAGAAMADETGIGAVSLASLAGQLGVRPPALYKHVGSLGDLRHRIAALAMAELAETLGEAVQGKAGPDALAAMFGAMRRYVTEHPGRYSATVGAEFQGQDDPLLAASARVIRSVGAVLSGFGIAPGEMDHAIRALRCVIHGFALLQAANAFQWGNDPDESFAWMILFVNAGLRGMGGKQA